MKYILVLVLAALLLCPFLASCQTATYYKDSYEGKPTSNGDIFWQWKMTCASNDYPAGTILRIYYKTKWVDVRVNDTMVDDGVIDLTKTAFMVLADTSVGRLRGIKIEVVKW